MPSSMYLGDRVSTFVTSPLILSLDNDTIVFHVRKWTQ